MTRSSTKELFTRLDNPERVFRSKRRLFETSDLVESNSPKFVLFSDIKEHLEEETTKEMTETIEQYMSKTCGDYGSSVTWPKKNTNTHFELKGHFLKELCNNTFRGSNHSSSFPYIPNWCRKPLVQERTSWFTFNLGSPEIESLFQAWERFKELLMKCPQHYLTDMQDVILFYNGLDVSTRQILDSKGVVPSMIAANAKVTIQQMAEYS
ncbi:hypothetical protein Tco_0266782 [Tanacetum coccineum]